jgi:HK97 family phage major capsid protein
MSLKEMLEQRAKHIADARAIYTKAEGEKRELTAQEKEQADKLLNDAESLRAKVDEKTKDEQRSTRLASMEADLDKPVGRRSGHNNGGNGERREEVRTLEWKDGYGQTRSLRLEGAGQRDRDEYREQFGRYLVTGNANGLMVVDEQRSLQADLPAAGGYVLAPTEFIGRLIQAVDNEVFMRRFGTVLPPGNGIGAPSLDADPADPTWVSELAIGSEDTTMAFGKRELKPHDLAQFIKISKKLLRAGTVINVDAVVRQRLSYKLGVVMENAYLNGLGGGQPLGVFTASSQGISTGRDVSTDNTTTAITFDGLKNAKWTLKSQYHARAQWIFHRDGGKQIDKLKDGNGQYLWQPSVVVGQPDRLLNFPVNFSEYAPNTFTTGQYVGILGDFSHYWIQDSLNATIQVLMEIYAATNQNGYLARFESDGMPTLEEAFVRVKLA